MLERRGITMSEKELIIDGFKKEMIKIYKVFSGRRKYFYERE